MREHHNADELSEIKKVLDVFADFIAVSGYFDIVFSPKVGYLMIPLEEGVFSHATEVEEIDSAESLCDELLDQVCGDVLEESDVSYPSLYESSPVVQKKARQQMQRYLSRLPEYAHLMERQFENPHE